MTAVTAAAAMARGVRAVYPDAVCREVPLADGGEGFVATLAAALEAEIHEITAADALGRARPARLALVDDLAVIEAAEAVGLASIAPAERSIMSSSTAGVGTLLLAALDAGVRRIVLGLGGSATNDGGAGMLHALGVVFRDRTGQPLEPVPSALARVASVDASGLDGRLAGVELSAACDVTSPLCGPEGASAVFGPQKGASPAQVLELDGILRHLAEASGYADAATLPGSGAAGGLGWALRAFLGATLRPGVELVTDIVGLAEAVKDADLVLTGEGSVDEQTRYGKTPAGVARIARAAGIPVVILAGRVAPSASTLTSIGVTELIQITPAGVPLARALQDGESNLERATAEFMTRWQ